MKTKQIISSALLTILITFFISSCEQNDPDPYGSSILPEKFSVSVPASLSADDMDKKSAYQVDTLNGNAIYRHLRFFIAAGRNGARIVEDVIRAIRIYQIDRPMRLTFTGEEDGKDKNLTVIKDSYFDGVTWEFQLNITDAESEGNEDGGLGIQIFWNRNPVKGIAILKPSNMNKDSRPVWSDAVLRIDYSDAGEKGYDEHMLVAISGMPLVHPLIDPFSMSGMKMFVGKEGEFVDVYGNSDHPNAVFFSEETGFSWSFVASANRVADVACAEVGLPPSNLDETSREVLLEQYSVKNVFTNQIYNLWPYIDQESVEAYLFNTEAPGFFDGGGFIQGGTLPGENWEVPASRIMSLNPYNPYEVSTLDIHFKQD